MDLTHYHFEIDDGVAVVSMDKAGESMNTIGPDLLTDFASILDELETNDAITAVVLTSAKKDFLAGADIRWFETLDQDTARTAILAGHAEFARLEALHAQRGKPVVAAIHGACLGGGLEMALLASMRIATDSTRTKLGQPEVQLGVIPAGGATQRLPKVVGIATALDLILSGRQLRARQARKIGLVDEVVPHQVLLDVAKKRAREAVGVERSGTSVKEFLAPSHLQALALEQNPMGRRVLFRKAEERMLGETKGNYPAPVAALDCVRTGIEDGNDAGYAAEAKHFGELIVSPESRALRSLFFASQMMKYFTGTTAPPRDVRKVGVLGGGLMGGGIATVSAWKAGSSVRIKEIDDAGVRRGLGYVAKVISGRAQRRRLGRFEAEQITNRVTGSTDWSGFGNVDLVIEAVFENLELKQSILREVEGIVPEDTVFATNTSSIPITDIAAVAAHPETVIGMHYFSPVEKMPLLEVITTEHTADWVTSTAVTYGKAQGKTVIVVNDGPGFYTSRILGPYSTEAAYLLEEGASVETIDGAMVQWGFPVGPLLLMDEVGIDVGAKITPIMVEAFGERMQPPAMMVKLVADDRMGRKNGRGFYSYDAKGKRGEVDDTVYASLGLGPRREIPRETIQERLALSFINEAALCLQEGILNSALDGDIGAIMGVGFPPFRGGPFWWVDQIGAKEIVARLDTLADLHGDRFAVADILREHADSGTSFR